mmetsp:Transcript_3639/g.11428  ORF Transcript_3639/g.11428 Transcript_3639/m.11428 type:complete len:223 (+) Transcript_3639:179-847(+)
MHQSRFSGRRRGSADRQSRCPAGTRSRLSFGARDRIRKAVRQPIEGDDCLRATTPCQSDVVAETAARKQTARSVPSVASSGDTAAKARALVTTVRNAPRTSPLPKEATVGHEVTRKRHGCSTGPCTETIGPILALVPSSCDHTQNPRQSRRGLVVSGASFLAARGFASDRHQGPWQLLFGSDRSDRQKSGKRFAGDPKAARSSPTEQARCFPPFVVLRRTCN